MGEKGFHKANLFRRAGTLIMGISLFLIAAGGKGDPESVQRVKRAILIFNFAQQVEWPNYALGTTFRMGVLGDNPIVNDLKNQGKNRSIKGLPLEVQTILDLDEVQGMDLLFVDRDYNFDIKLVLEKVAGKHILVISENYEFNQSMINLVQVEQNILYELNESQLRREGLRVSQVLKESAITSADMWQDLYEKSEQSLELEKQKVLEQKALIRDQEVKLADQQASIVMQNEELETQKMELMEQLQALEAQADKLEAQSFKIGNQTTQIDRFNDQIGAIELQMKAQEAKLKEKLATVARQELQIKAKENLIQAKEKEYASQVSLFEERARQIQQQNTDIESQAAKIQQQREELGAQTSLVESQKQILYLLVGFFSLLLLVAFLVFRSNRIRKKANRILTQKNLAIQLQSQQLEQANVELGQFAYIASHDLQEPLRTVANFVEVLQEDYGPQLDEQAETYFSLISDSTHRMKTLVKDLLDYSRIGRERDFVEIDCNQLLREIRDDLSTLIAERNAMLTIRNLPMIKGSKTDLRLLFQNLINNAIKFAKPDIPAEIEIHASQEGSDWVFAVKDNGIGIDPQHHEKIFVIFQRLHNKREFEGTGIGLAHCKKIVDLHGGKVWVDSSSGKGSTFFVSLPSDSPKT